MFFVMLLSEHYLLSYSECLSVQMIMILELQKNTVAITICTVSVYIAGPFQGVQVTNT
jgi:hypothetical protein